MQVGSWAPLYFFGVESHQNAIGGRITTVLSVVWMMMPFGAFSGVHLGRRALVHRPGSILAWTGIVFNSLYIAFGALCLLIISLGITA